MPASSARPRRQAVFAVARQVSGCGLARQVLRCGAISGVGAKSEVSDGRFSSLPRDVTAHRNIRGFGGGIANFFHVQRNRILSVSAVCGFSSWIAAKLCQVPVARLPSLRNIRTISAGGRAWLNR